MADELYPKPRHDRPHDFKEDDFIRTFCSFCGERRSHSCHDPDEKRRFLANWRKENVK